MADNRNSPVRLVKRCSEGHRLEDQFWTMAYEQLWPVNRRRHNRPIANAGPARRQHTGTTTPAARRA